MQVVKLSDSHHGNRSAAEISVSQGFNLFHFATEVNGKMISVIDAPENFHDGTTKSSSAGTPILFPFPNRIRDGKFSWEGTDYEFPPDLVGRDPNGHAIHGFCLDRPFRVIEQSSSSVTGRFQLSEDAPDRRPYWPADFILDLTYTLLDSRLRLDIRVENPSETTLPWGFGTHPYFRLPFGGGSQPKQCTVVVPASERWRLIDCLPTGETESLPSELDLREGRAFGSFQVDDIYTGLPEASEPLTMEVLDEPAGLQLTQRTDAMFREIVIYTPDGRPSVCLEPYTCITDAINLQQRDVDAGLEVLPPGAEVHTWIELELGLILV